MATLQQLRAQLTAKGYTTEISLAQPISLHTHPLITAPVVLVGIDPTTAKPYQEELVAEAIKKR